MNKYLFFLSMPRPDFSVTFMFVHFCTLERSIALNKLQQFFSDLQLEYSSKLQPNEQGTIETLRQGFQGGTTP